MAIIVINNLLKEEALGSVHASIEVLKGDGGADLWVLGTRGSRYQRHALKELELLLDVVRRDTGKAMPRPKGVDGGDEIALSEAMWSQSGQVDTERQHDFEFRGQGVDGVACG